MPKPAGSDRDPLHSSFQIAEDEEEVRGDDVRSLRIADIDDVRSLGSRPSGSRIVGSRLGLARAGSMRPCGESAPPGWKVCLVLVAVIVALNVLFTFFMLKAPAAPPVPDLNSQPRTYPSTAGEQAFAITLGIQRQSTMQSSTLVFIVFLAVVGASIPSTLVATFNPELVPPDFEAKGTLSNVAQDASSPHGRLFTVMLFTAGIMQTFSMYTFWLYKPWAPKNDFFQNPWNTQVFEPESERMWRTLWVTVPNVGFMFTAALPSLSDTEGYKLALALVHNLFAPLSMLFCLVMETVQLAYGEGAFVHFFTNEVTFPYVEITAITRQRVILALYTWAAGATFISIQVYLGLSLVGVKIRLSYSLALVSFYAEVACFILAFFLPVLAALETVSEPQLSLSTMDEAAWILRSAFNLTTMPPPTLEI